MTTCSNNGQTFMNLNLLCLQIEDTKALIEADVREGTFVSTKAVTDGLLLLKQNGVLLITGYAGTGKSRIGRHILHMFCTENMSHKCIKLNKLGEWEDNVNRNDNVMVLLDDIFGETNCIYDREKDTPILDKVHAYVCKGNIKVIITIRDTVIRQCQEVFNSHRLFKFKFGFIDLSSDKYLLSRTEKVDMLEIYMKAVRKADYDYDKGFFDCKGYIILNKGEVSNITEENPVKGFPLVVYQFVHNDKYFQLGSKFFDRPTEAMLEEMNAIRCKGEDHRKFMIQYAVTVYTAINENYINLDDSSCVLKMTEITDAIYGVTIKLKKGQISDAIKQLEGSYLVNTPHQRSYRFHHQTLLESVILSFAQIDEENLNQIIPLISWSFILKMVKPKSYIEKDGEVVLRIPTNNLKCLASRLVDIYMSKSLSGIYTFYIFLHSLSNTEIFKQEYRFLLPCLLEALEKEDSTDRHTENIIRRSAMEYLDYYPFIHMKNTESFLTYMLVVIAGTENQFDIYSFILKTLNKIINNSDNNVTIDILKNAIIESLYRICSTIDIQNVKATFDVVKEHKIPVLLDQGVDFTKIKCDNKLWDFTDVHNEENHYPSCVFLAICIWKAYQTFNEPVLEYLLSKYNETPFDANLFLGKVFDERRLELQRVSCTQLKWIIERCDDAALVDTDIIFNTACHYQNFDAVEYLASRFEIDGYSCLKTFLNVCTDSCCNQDLFNFLLTKIDLSSKELIPICISAFRRNHQVPDYLFDYFLPVCLNDMTILTVACELGQFFFVKRIMENSNIQFLTANCPSALIEVCTFNVHYDNREKEKIKIIKYIVDICGFELLDFKAANQKACDSRQFIIVEWFINNIDLTMLDLYTIIKSALETNHVDILDIIVNKIEIESLDKRKVLKIVAEEFNCNSNIFSTSILEIVSKIWDDTEDKEELKMEEIVSLTYGKYGNFKLLMWIHTYCNPHISINRSKLLMSAFRCGRFDEAKWILQVSEQTSLDEQKLFTLLFEQILENKVCQSDLDTVKWILQKIEINPLDLKSIALNSVTKACSCFIYTNKICFDLLIPTFDKYLSIEDICVIINKFVDKHNFVPVNWFLQYRNSYSFDKQNILNKACANGEIETVQMLRKHFHSLDITQAIIHATKEGFSGEISYNDDSSVACLDLLWEHIVSIDIRTCRKIVSAAFKTASDSYNLMTWILLKTPHDQIAINEILITCCRESRFDHVKYIFNKVDNTLLDIKEAFVQACRMASPSDEEIYYTAIKNKNSVKMLVDFLFKKLNDKQTSFSSVVKYLLKRKTFCLILYFLQSGYGGNIDMKNLLNLACQYRHFKLVQWILTNVQHKDLNIESAFFKASEACVNHIDMVEQSGNEIEFIICLALIWHYIQDINLLDIDAALQFVTEFRGDYYSTSVQSLQTWLLNIKKINQKKMNERDGAVLNTELNKMQETSERQQVKDGRSWYEDTKHNDDSSSSKDCPSPMKRLHLEKE